MTDTLPRATPADLEAVWQRLLALRWQGMDSAPRDGTTILIYGPVYYEVGSGGGDKPCWSEAHWAGGWEVHINSYYSLTAEPTAWMPLPPVKD